MKFFVLGCNGMAGHTISLYLQEQGHEVIGFDLKTSQYIKSVTGDAKDVTKLEEIIKSEHFDSVINCIGVLNQFAESNKGLGVYLNAYLPHFLAEITVGTDTQVIHMSTDCVFSGKRGGYTEHDLRDGETFYDRSKALGELDDGKNITMRNSIVGLDLNPKGIGLLNWFMQQAGEVKGYTKAIWTGQTTLQLAKTMEVAAREKAHGLYNMVPDASISKHDLLQLFNRHLRCAPVRIVEVEGLAANKSLKRTCYDFEYRIPDYETMIVDLKNWLEKHRVLYPHYTL